VSYMPREYGHYWVCALLLSLPHLSRHAGTEPPPIEPYHPPRLLRYLFFGTLTTLNGATRIPLGAHEPAC
jgi:hypothetical protein